MPLRKKSRFKAYVLKGTLALRKETKVGSPPNGHCTEADAWWEWCGCGRRFSTQDKLDWCCFCDGDGDKGQLLKGSHSSDGTVGQNQKR